MHFTQYFLHTRKRPDRILIRDEWIMRVISNPQKTAIQADGRIRFWGVIPEMDNRVLRVIVLEDRITIHNAFFDRNATL
jgi:hypothetical protein